MSLWGTEVIRVGPVVHVLPSKGAEADTEEQNAQKNMKQGKNASVCEKLVCNYWNLTLN